MAGNRGKRATLEPVDPRHGRPVVEPYYKLGPKNHAPRATDHNSHKIGPVSRRHEIDHRRRAGLGLEFGFEYERAGTIAPADAER